MRSFLPLLLCLVSCCDSSEPAVVSNIAPPEDPLKKSYLVKVTFCDKAKSDTTIIVNTYDGHPPSSADIHTFNEPVPVYRGGNFAYLNVCDLNVVGVKSDQVIEGSDLILSQSDSLIDQ